MLPPITLSNWLLAFTPILAVLILMAIMRWGGSKAGPVGWIIAVFIAFGFFGADIKVVSIGSLKGLWTTIFVLYIIWGALALYNVVDKVKGFEVITKSVTGWTGGNRLLQLFTVGWAFPSFIQGVCGFGAPVAISAPLLVGLGFNPILAATATLIGHAWSITFGSLGSSYGVIVNILDIDAQSLALWSSSLLVVSCFAGGGILAYLYDGWKGLGNSLPSVIFLGAAMGGSFWLTINYLTPYLGSLVGGLVGLVVGSWVLIRMPWHKKSSQGIPEKAATNALKKENKMTFIQAASAYLVLILVVFIVYLTPLQEALSHVQLSLSFPETTTAYGYTTPETASYAPIELLTTPGTLIFFSVILAVLYYRYKGYWQRGYTLSVLRSLVKQATPTTITVISMSMMSVVMMESGMTTLLAHGIADFSKGLYPLLAPLLGALGAFMTGSNTSSNILLSAFQMDVANILNLNAVIILSLQTAGGSLGCMFSPMKVALGTGVTGIAGSEGIIIKKTLGYGIALCLITGVIGMVALMIV